MGGGRQRPDPRRNYGNRAAEALEQAEAVRRLTGRVIAMEEALQRAEERWTAAMAAKTASGAEAEVMGRVVPETAEAWTSTDSALLEHEPVWCWKHQEHDLCVPRCWDRWRAQRREGRDMEAQKTTEFLRQGGLLPGPDGSYRSPPRVLPWLERGAEPVGGDATRC
jgi:hypothetical protein